MPNDAELNGHAQRVIILTGPNMLGKSVFVRQVALIVLMAQMGSFVPASAARIGLTDRVFTRVGASDDIAQGRSTFLVEMSETSHILRHATARSLIVLDEVGRGTSTYDGISLAWAIAEEIHNVVGAKTLFATHYHELTQLEALPVYSASRAIKFGDGVEITASDVAAPEPPGEPAANAFRNYTMAVKERGSEVVFLRQVVPGGAEKSFGIHVARLAGLHARIIARANDVLRSLELERGSVHSVSALTDEAPRNLQAERSGTVHSVSPRADEAAQILEGATRAPDAELDGDAGPSAVRTASVTRLRSVLADDRAEYRVGVDEWRLLLGELTQVDVANLTPVQALNWLNDMQIRVKQMLVR